MKNKEMNKLSKKWSRWLAVLAAAAMIFTMLPMTAVYAEDAGEGYITDANGVMAYKFLNDETSGRTIELRGFYSGAWKQTSYRSRGISTYFVYGQKSAEYFSKLKVDSFSGFPTSSSLNEGFKKVDTTGNAENAGNNFTVKVTPSFVNNGNQIKLTYEVTNNNPTAEVFSLGAASDVQISADDHATALLNANGTGFKLISTKAEDKDPVTGEYAQLNFWGKATAGVTDTTDFWYGYWTERSGFNKSPDYSEFVSMDTGMSYSWKNQTIAANSTKTFSVLFGVGGLGSDVIENSYRVTILSAEGGTASASAYAAAENDIISLSATPDSGYTFAGWDVVSGNIQISADNSFVMPAEDVTIKPVFERAADDYYTITVITEGHGSATASRTTARVGDIIYIMTAPDDGYVLNSISVNNGKISGSSFAMLDSNVTVNVSFTEDLSRLVGIPHSYIFSYNKDMELIATNSNRSYTPGSGEAVITAKLGADYAGCKVTLYKGRKNTSVKVDEAILDSNGNATFTLPVESNFTLIVEE